MRRRAMWGRISASTRELLIAGIGDDSLVVRLGQLVEAVAVSHGGLVVDDFGELLDQLTEGPRTSSLLAAAWAA